MYRNGEPIDESRHLLGKFILILAGILIGMSLGLYIGIRTLPLPNQTTIYVLRGQ